MSALGSLVVSLMMDTAEFTSASSKASRSLEKLQADAARIGKAIGVGIGVAAGGFGALVKSGIDAADAMDETSQRLGVTTEDFSRLAYAATFAGVSQDDLATALSKVSKEAAEAAGGGEQAQAKFEALGISVTDTNGRVKDSTTLFREMADKFAGLRDGSAKTALAMEFFGKSGAQMVPLLNEGSQGLAAMAAEADALGVTLDSNTAAAAGQFNDRLDQMQTMGQVLGRRIGAELLPTVNSLADQFLTAAKEGGGFETVVRSAAAGGKILAIVMQAVVRGVGMAGDFIGGLGAQLVALVSGDFAEAQRIGTETIRNMQGSLTDLFESVDKTWTGAAESAVAGAKSLDKGTDAPLVKVKKNVKAVRTELQKLNDAAAKNLEKLRIEVDTDGASERIKKLIELSRQGVDPRIIGQTNDLMKQREAQEEATKAAEKAAEAQRDARMEGESLRKDTLSEYEKLAEKEAEWQDLLKQGAITQETYDRALFSARVAANEAASNMDDVAEKQNEFAEKFRSNVQDIMGDTFADAMEGNFSDIGDSFTQMLNRMVAQALAAQLAESLFGGTSEGGTGGMMGTALSWIGSVWGGKASGGPVSAGHPYIVGEHGPEVMIPATSGSVGAAGGTSNVYNVQVTATPGMSRQTAMQQGADMAEGLRRASTRNG